MKKNLNPEWNEDLTLSITDPIQPVKIVSDSYISFFFITKVGKKT